MAKSKTYSRWVSSLNPYEKINVLGILGSRRYSLAGHFGFGHSDILQRNDDYAGNIMGGVSMVTSRGLDWSIADARKSMRESALMSISLDAVYYFDHAYFDETLETVVTSEDYRELSFSVMVEGYRNGWTRYGLFGVRYGIGVGLTRFYNFERYLQLRVGVNLALRNKALK